MDLLFDAIDFLRPVVKSHDEIIGEEAYSIYLSMLSDLSSFLYFKGEKDRAFEVSQEFMDLDNECYIAGRIVYYSILVERGEYKKVIDAAESDICETPMSEYSRAIAIFELDGPTEDASDAALQAISIDPDMAFYVAGFWTFDDEEIESLEEEEEEEMDELMMQSVVLSDLWASTEDRLAFLSSIVFAFGYLTGRTEEPEDIYMLEDSYRSLGCLEEMRDARDAVQAMIVDGKERSEADEEALLLFRDIRDRGLFG
jgi:tetratricopeptide (TPR) repeat protein